MKTPDEIMQKHHIKIVRLKEDKPMLYNSIRKSMDDFADQYAKWKLNKLSERQTPPDPNNNPDTKQLIIGDVSGSYSVNDMDDAYDKGFKDAMLKYRE